MFIADSLKDRQTAITAPELAKMLTLSRRQLSKMAAAILATERHFTPTQLAALWG
jgi:transcriptional antiterminator